MPLNTILACVFCFCDRVCSAASNISTISLWRVNLLGQLWLSFCLRPELILCNNIHILWPVPVMISTAGLMSRMKANVLMVNKIQKKSPSRRRVHIQNIHIRDFQELSFNWKRCSYFLPITRVVFPLLLECPLQIPVFLPIQDTEDKWKSLWVIFLTATGAIFFAALLNTPVVTVW